jgi:hypothetical protein
VVLVTIRDLVAQMLRLPVEERGKQGVQMHVWLLTRMVAYAVLGCTHQSVDHYCCSVLNAAYEGC